MFDSLANMEFGLGKRRLVPVSLTFTIFREKPALDLVQLVGVTQFQLFCMAKLRPPTKPWVKQSGAAAQRQVDLSLNTYHCIVG